MVNLIFVCLALRTLLDSMLAKPHVHNVKDQPYLKLVLRRAAALVSIEDTSLLLANVSV